MPGLVEAHDLGLEPVALGVAEVHPVQLGREQGRLVAAGAGADLEDHVAVVVRVARQQQDLELLEQAGLVGLEPVDLLAGHRAQLVVGVGGVAQLARAGELGRGSPRGGGRPRPTGSRRASSWPSRRSSDGSVEVSGQRELGLELVVLARDLGQLGVEVAHARCGGSLVGRGCDRWRSVAVG